MKSLIFFSFIFANTVLNAQIGRKEAEEDWAKGAAKYYIWGLKTAERKGVEDALYFEHLGVFLTNKGCLVSGMERDYNDRIKEKLKEKYGRDMFKLLKHDVHIFYDSLNKLKTRKAIFSGGEKHLLEWFNHLAQYIHDDKKNTGLGDNVKITLIFTINRKGKCKQFSLSKTESPEFNIQLWALFKGFFKHFKWLPAKENGVRVEEEKTYEIVFNPE